MTSGEHNDNLLNDADQHALDALAAAEFDVSRVPPAMRPRAEAVARVLGLLDAAGTVDPVQRESTCAAAMKRVGEFAFNPETAQLSGGDEDALEALVIHGMDSSRVASGMRARAEHQLRVLSLLEHAADSSAAARGGAEGLISRSMKRIDAHEAARRGRMTVGAEQIAAPRRRLRMPDLISVAAMLLVAVSIMWPVAGAMRDRARQTACFGNFSSLASAFGAYAGDHKSAMPMASESPAGSQWMHVGVNPAQSNSANLYTLVRAKYSDLPHLACAGNECAVVQPASADAKDWSKFEEVSYSYLNVFGRRGAATGAVFNSNKAVPILSDRSPVVMRMHAGEKYIDVMENSLSHNGRGQAVLMNDGAARWLTTPMIDENDNIWIPTQIEVALRKVEQLRRGGRAEPLRGVETPSNDFDAFMAP